MSDYFLCILVVMRHKGSVVSKHELAYQTISDLSSDLNWLALNMSVPGLLCIHTSWVKASSKTIERKIQNCVGQEHSPVFLHSQPHDFESSPLELTDAFIPLCKAKTSLMKRSEHPSFHRMFHIFFPVHNVKGFCEVNKHIEGHNLFNAFLLYLLQEDHVCGSLVCAEPT